MMPCWLAPRNPGQFEVDIDKLTGTEALVPVEIVRFVNESKDWLCPI